MGTRSRRAQLLASQRRAIYICCIMAFHCAQYCAGAASGPVVLANSGLRAKPVFAPICSQMEEHFIESEGKESSLILEFNTARNSSQSRSCTRILSAPPNYGFVIRLILPKIRHSVHPQENTILEPAASSGHNHGEGAGKRGPRNTLQMSDTSTILKTERQCPLSIFSWHEPRAPQWRIDPCQLEDTAPEMDDPVRLFDGRVRIVWEHANHTLNSKLMITVLGKGHFCRSKEKHQCMKNGDEPILCISKALTCDGIRHCPFINEYDSDEDYVMCWKRRGMSEAPSIETGLFEHFALEVFRNLFAFDISTPAPPQSSVNFKNSKQSPETLSPGTAAVGVSNGTIGHEESKNVTSFLGNHQRRNSTRTGVNSDLSKYGPWGYLMLGMLLCGGALLICGLWASASQHAANNERESALQSANAIALSRDDPPSVAAPPNYEELDPPPPYSALFPNQKASSSNTVCSLEAPSSARTFQQSTSAGHISEATDVESMTGASSGTSE